METLTAVLFGRNKVVYRKPGLDNDIMTLAPTEKLQR